MTSKTTAQQYFENEEPAPETTTLRVDIAGLSWISGQTFEISGIRHRHIDHGKLSDACGGISEALNEKIAELIFRDDLVNLLADRIS